MFEIFLDFSEMRFCRPGRLSNDTSIRRQLLLGWKTIPRFQKMVGKRTLPLPVRSAHVKASYEEW